jgi:hypothetical protein
MRPVGTMSRAAGSRSDVAVATQGKGARHGKAGSNDGRRNIPRAAVASSANPCAVLAITRPALVGRNGSAKGMLCNIV